MARHPIPYVNGTVYGTSGSVAAGSLELVLNPDPPNERFGFIGSYHIQARVRGAVSVAQVSLKIGGARVGDLADSIVLGVGPFTVVLMGEAVDPGDGGFHIFAEEAAQGSGAQIDVTDGVFAAWPSGWFPWQ